MSQTLRTWSVIILISLTLVRGLPSPVEACCAVAQRGEFAGISNQMIFVAWDPQTNIEHFVRKADFNTKRAMRNSEGQQEGEGTNANFGFLVPSPSLPEVEASEDELFDRLHQKTLPLVEERNRWSVDPFPLILKPFLLMAPKSVSNQQPPTDSLQVFGIKKVAGYEVAILKADNADELAKWLKENNYDSPSDFEEWIGPYIEQGWFLSAFKYDAGGERSDVKSVRISFVTNKPVFPYRVPKSQFSDNRRKSMLEVFLIGPGAGSGKLGIGEERMDWSNGGLKYSKPLNDHELETLVGGGAPTKDLVNTRTLWLTRWFDPSWPSSDKDLWFTFDPKAKPYQEVIVNDLNRSVSLPIDILLLGALGLGYFVRGLRGRK